jgi:hypothetical protein
MKNLYKNKSYLLWLSSEFAIDLFCKSKWSCKDQVEIVYVLSHQAMNVHTHNKTGKYIYGVMNLRRKQ